MLEDLKAIKTDKRTLRRFGISFSIVFLVWGAAAFFHQKDASLVFLVLSPLFLLFALCLPSLLKPFHVFLNAVFILITTLLTYIVLAIVFYLVMTPLSLLMRLMGKDILGQRMHPEDATYWVEREDIFDQKIRYERQF